MKYCVNCGNQLHDEAVICVKCGYGTGTENQTSLCGNSENSALSIAVKIFLILGCIGQGWLLLPLAWCLPMTISIFKALRENRPIGIGLKICTLLFVNMIAGICLLCMDDDKAVF